MTVNYYALIMRALEEGLPCGYHRAHKHGKPIEEQIFEAQAAAVMNNICEVINFDEPE